MTKSFQNKRQKQLMFLLSVKLLKTVFMSVITLVLFVFQCIGLKWICDGGHNRGFGFLCLVYNQGVSGLPSGEMLIMS